MQSTSLKPERDQEISGEKPPRRIDMPWWRSVVVVVLALAVCGVCWMGPAISKTSEQGVTMELPYTIGRYVSQPMEISEGEKTILPSDTEFARRQYLSSSGDRIMCTVVLSGGEKRSIHRPEVCLPAQGWSIQGAEVLDVPLKSGKKLGVTHLTLFKDVPVGPGKTQRIESSFMYWFVGKDKVTPSHWERVFLTSYDRVTRNLNHRWAFVIVHSNIGSSIQPGGRDAESTVKMMEQFIADVVPTFQLTGVE